MNYINVLIVIVFCATQSFSLHIRQSRIALGHNANPHSAPYIVSLQAQLNNGLGYHHSCGGIIITNHWILTAAHCLSDPERVKRQIILAGRHNITANENATEQLRTIDWYQNHEKYPGGSVVAPFDIALIYIHEPFAWTHAVQPIKLPKLNQQHTGMATLFGWGLLSESYADFPDILQTGDIPIISNEECKKTFNELIDDSNICTVDEIGISACSSDSGGPLIQHRTDTNKLGELIGIVSWGPACGRPNLKSISVFVRVSSLIPWIEKTISSYVASLTH